MDAREKRLAPISGARDMDNQDRQAIETLFSRLDAVERQGAPRDSEAEAFIRDRVARQPAAPYLMAQTIVMQDVALKEAERRIAELERGAGERQGEGLFSGLFGRGQSGRRMSSVPAAGRAPAAGRYDTSQGQRGGGGFLAGAAQTAMGVAGGLLLGNAIAGMLGSNEAQAAETSPQEDQAADAGEEGGDGDGGFLGGLFGGGDGGDGDFDV
jgi:hypothetical protein